jgi:hypothetical protein
MDFGFEQVATEIIRGVMDAVGDKPGLSPERKSAAQQALVCTIMAFNPRDQRETTLAGQCMVYDHLLRDGVHDLLSGQQEEIKIKNRANVLGTGKLFLQTMATLDRIQARSAKNLAFAKTQESQSAEPPPQPSVQPSRGATTKRRRSPRNPPKPPLRSDRQPSFPRSTRHRPRPRPQRL